MAARSRSSARWVLALAALIAASLFGITWWFVQARESHASAHEYDSIADSSDTHAKLESALDGVGAASESQRAVELGGVALKPDPVRPAASPEMLDVMVVVGSDRAPVPGAELVWMAEPAGESSRQWEWLSECRLDAELAEHGQRTSTDAEGRARIPAQHLNGQVVARSGELWGFTEFTLASESPVIVTVRRDGSLRIHVTDASGASVAGLRVALRESWSRAHFDVLSATTTAPDGVAVLEHAEWLCNSEFYGHSAWSAAIASITLDPIQVDLDLRHWPSSTVELRTRAFGECEVLIVEADGSPCRDELIVTLSPRKSVESEDVLREASGVQLRGIRDGRALFTGVDSGIDLVATAQGVHSQASHRASGVASAIGQRSTITIRMGESIASMRGRMVDANGTPIAKSGFEAVLSSRASNRNDEWLAFGARTDESGRFKVDVPPQAADAGPMALVIRRVADNGSILGGANVPLSAPIVAGESDLGDVVMATLPALFEGIVVDANEQPVRNATINIASRSVPSGTRANDQPEWRPMWNINSVTDEQGRFVVVGATRDSEFVLAAEKAGLRGRAVQAVKGARNLILHVAPGGDLCGQILLDASVARSSVTMWIQDPSNEFARLDEMRRDETTLDEEGKFAARNLLPGDYTISIDVSDAEVQSIANVHVDSGKPSRDPRLNPLDLRGRAIAIVLSVVDVDHNPIRQGYVDYTDTGSQEERWGLITNGTANLTHSGSGLDAVVQSHGYCSATVKHVTGDQEVVLHRTPRIRLVLPKNFPLPDAPKFVAVHLSRESQDGDDDSESARFDANGEASLESPTIGRVRVTIQAAMDVKAQDGSDDWNATTVEGDAPLFLDVRELGGEQRFEIAVDPAKVADAFRKLEGR